VTDHKEIQMFRPKLFAVGAAVLASTAATLVPASAALAAVPPPVVEAQPAGTALLVGGGGAVDVPVDYRCDADTMEARLTLVQGRKNKVALGYGYGPNPVCDSTTHHVTIRVQADVNGRPFAKGQAAITTVVHGCTDDGDIFQGGTQQCADDTVDGVITLTKR
jgi:hypothetical protein